MVLKSASSRCKFQSWLFAPRGAVAKRLCPGLQIRLVRFDSGPRLQFFWIVGGLAMKRYAGIAQLVERNLAKVEVASSSLVSRSNQKKEAWWLPFFMPLFGVILWVLSHCLTVPRPAERAPSVAPSQQQCVARSPPTILLWSEWWNGRHRRLKISWPHGRAGSIPASDTMRRAHSLGRQRTSKWVVCPLGGDAQNIVLTHLVL